ncbi:prolyl 4-hydroxylase subunit alpha-1 isoform X2 [Drosophila bipectinata]|uniref:prolyl 4-hydroxylase subunit alpha-1 isoform X2 n=1 Tax=Drosophila bipectinata TaxID=42026 RepID=UPI0038B29AED
MRRILFSFLIFLANMFLQYKAQDNNIYTSHDFAISLESQLSLLKLQEIHVKNLKNYKNKLAEHYLSIKRAIKYTEYIFNSVMENKENIIVWFKFLRHMHNDWHQYLMLFRKELGSDEIFRSQELLERLPTSTDFEESMAAIYKIQVVYDLDAFNMTRGILNGKSYNVKNWSADECLIMGLLNQLLKHFGQSEQWFRLALIYFKGHPRPKELDIKIFKLANILELLVEANKDLGRYSKAKEYANEVLTLQPNHNYIKTQLLKLSHLDKKQPEFTKENEKMYQLQKAICTKEYPKISVKQKLKLSQAINLRYYPNFLTKNEIEALKMVSRPELKRDENLSWNCSCKIAELRSSTRNIVNIINKRIRDTSGLDKKGSEVLEVINYGISGNYNPDDREISKKDHKANVLIFLNNIEQGGETIFPSLNIKFKPKMGTMLLWLNSEKRVWHHQCPLLVGNMWLAMKRLY